MYPTTTAPSPGTSRPAGPELPSMRYPLESFRLDNGLRVLLLPDPALPVAEVAVLYGVGYRSEPRDRSGFAHLFEHLMFQGAAETALASHTHQVQGAGGAMNAYTRPDHTYYHQNVPGAALDLSLRLESERMLRPRFTEEGLRTQIAVVSEEIRGHVLNRPYGDFPWQRMCAALFDTHPNTHDGYGSFRELRSARVEQAEEFFARHYGPGNAVLCLVGGFDPERAAELVHRHFDRVDARPAAPPTPTAEPQLTEVREHRYVDRLAPAPAFATGWRVPTWSDSAEYFVHLVLCEILTGGTGARLPRRLTDTDGLAFGIGAQTGFRGDTLGCRPSAALVVSGNLRDADDTDRARTALLDELALLADRGPDARELRRAAARAVSALLRDMDQTVNRAVAFGAAELHRGAAASVNEWADALAGIGPDDIARTAATLAAAGHCTVTVLPE
ncbi:insulinase family protein [Streptomyces sp. OfavH-34-F]|uniref:M16 family metallopeptidase n=1 Tax=unclassified Streptomyces TaxID=2593676 RepID=UPI001EF3B28F|nr:pitrilysin family protein [Streptomyces sp. OfavH-34-F]MCG7526714.1 insulinase family protein [Streptomyces sp. OfavH-34-F]